MMTSTKQMQQHMHNFLLRAKLAAAFEAGDTATVQKISQAFDRQQIQLMRNALHRKNSQK